MQQRRLRLGDILDDYCPRERRITNHVVVAMIDEDVKQTRCSTCDTEHEYKHGKAPAPRRKKSGALFQDVPEGTRPRAVAHPAAGSDDTPTDDASPDAVESVDEPSTPGESPAEPAMSASADAATDELENDEREAEDDGPVHRRLIRATLPRPEGHVPERKEPDFTMRQPTGRDFNGNNRNGQRGRHRPMRQAQGQHGNETRFGGPRHGAGAPRHGGGGQGQQGNRPGPPQRGGGRPPAGQNRGPGRKRGR
jgi:hypothetical protein